MDSTEAAVCSIQRRDTKGDVNDEVSDETPTRQGSAAAAADEGWATQDTRPQHSDELAEHRLMRVMAGCLDNLPPLQSKIVRIFTSSTFTGRLLCYTQSSSRSTCQPQVSKYISM